MKAAVVDRYGPPEVVQIREVPKPVPSDNEILVRIRTTTVNSGDARVRALRVPRGLGLLMRFGMGFNGPKTKIGGFEAAGVVEAVGANVTRFKPGDRAVGSHGFKFGLHAEFATFAETDAIVAIPDGLSDAAAVAVLFGGATSRFFLARGGLKAGERLLINGASGAVGVYAIQLAKLAGAHVTAICSAANAEFVRGLGADEVIAYDREDFIRGGKTYDVIMDNHGNAPYARVKHMLKPGGRFLMVIGDLWQMIEARWSPAVVASGDDNESAVSIESYSELLDLAAKGAIKPVIDRVFPFEQIVEAHRLVDSGRKRGSAVVAVG
ncbi:MAG: NAD(P)-dependent alcohol dehydrogenase [Devosia sp.]